jgi:trigger factor
MYEHRIDEMARDWAFKYNMDSENFARSTGVSLATYREGFREIAEKQVKFRLALEKIGELEAFEVSEEEIEAEMKKMADGNRMTLDKVKLIVTPDAVSDDLKTAKALDFIKEHAVVTEVPRKPRDDDDDYDDE